MAFLIIRCLIIMDAGRRRPTTMTMMKCHSYGSTCTALLAHPRMARHRSRRPLPRLCRPQGSPIFATDVAKEPTRRPCCSDTHRLTTEGWGGVWKGNHQSNVAQLSRRIPRRRTVYVSFSFDVGFKIRSRAPQFRSLVQERICCCCTLGHFYSELTVSLGDSFVLFPVDFFVPAPHVAPRAE